MTKWEYTWQITGTTEETGIPAHLGSQEGQTHLAAILDHYGSEGWELVSVTPVGSFGMYIKGIFIDIDEGSGYGEGGEGEGQGGTTHLIWVFKRPRAE